MVWDNKDVSQPWPPHIHCTIMENIGWQGVSQDKLRTFANPTKLLLVIHLLQGWWQLVLKQEQMNDIEIWITQFISFDYSLQLRKNSSMYQHFLKVRSTSFVVLPFYFTEWKATSSDKHFPVCIPSLMPYSGFFF